MVETRNANMPSQSAVEDNLKSGSYKFRVPQKARSEVWKRFGIVIDQDGHDLPYAACIKCLGTVAYTGKGTGTSSMMRHKCRTIFSNQLTIKSCISGEKQTRANLRQIKIPCLRNVPSLHARIRGGTFGPTAAETKLR